MSSVGDKKRRREDTEIDRNSGSAVPTVGPARPVKVVEKKAKVLQFEQLYLDKLPSAEMYEKSFMHRAEITHVAVSKLDYVLTGSRDGHLKFWKKNPVSIEFVKHFRAHLAPISAMAVSHDGTLLCTAAGDKTIKVYDILNFDMITMMNLNFVPKAVQWIFPKGAAKQLLAISERASGAIHIFNPRAQEEKPRFTLNIHSAPVELIVYNAAFNCVISTDASGSIEYWLADEDKNFPFPADIVKFSFKLETDLFDFAKAQHKINSLSVSQDGSKFVALGSDRKIRVFKFLSGKKMRIYDESLSVYNTMQKDDKNPYHVEEIDFGRRIALERELDKADFPERNNVIFDESGNFILFPTMIGVKVINIVTNKLSRVLGFVEGNIRFTSIALYQGKSLGELATGSRNLDADYDPTLICAGFKKERFYLFTRREPNEESGAIGRDVFNEKPKKEAIISKAAPVNLPSGATIHTTKGDIHIKLFPEECPKAVENFTTHARDNYYNNHTFHRVIRGFMIQTGDPFGDGTGGESIWGKDFEDEIHKNLRHDRPGTVSMANAGPNTNGSQFFITTVAVSRLDGKHTIFGRVTRGIDVVHDIESVQTDKATDKPLEDVKIVSISISSDD